MWQKFHEQHGGDHFTVVGLALDAEGVKPAKLYYDKYGVKFPSLVDPNYATKFTAVPYTFFINEHGVVIQKPRSTRGLEKLIRPKDKLKPITAAIRAKFSTPGQRLQADAIKALAQKYKDNPNDLQTVVELSSRYLDVQRNKEARAILETAIAKYDAKKTARGDDATKTRLLGEAYFQLSRACADDRKAAVEHATLAFYLKPSVGYGKQIARIIAPEKFDTASGRFDNRFREGTLRRLRMEREQWLSK